MRSRSSEFNSGFSRRRLRNFPPPIYAAARASYFEAVLGIVAQQRIDALIPVHEQAYLFATARHRIPSTLAVALADFAAFEQVQSKAAFSALLDQLAVPQPATTIIRSADGLMAERAYPFFLKAAFGTASAEVWRIDDRKQLEALLPSLEARGAFEDCLIAQAAFGLVAAKLLLNPASAGRIAASTVRAYRLPAKSVRRLRPQVV
jgi:carbamoylphosphate synthase large subunit